MRDLIDVFQKTFSLAKEDLRYEQSFWQNFLLDCTIYYDMFPNSTQATHWMFKDEEALQKTKSKTNKSFIQKHVWQG